MPATQTVSRFAVVAAVMLRSSESPKARLVPLTVRACQVPGVLVQAALVVIALARLFFWTFMVTDPASTWHLADVTVMAPIRLLKKLFSLKLLSSAVVLLSAPAT